jgi:hypothetical protein
MTFIEVGKARALVSRATPPEDKTLLWHKQTNPQLNEQIGELYFYDWNPDVNEWVRLRQDGNVQLLEQFTATANQTVFELLNNVVLAELTQINIVPGATLTYDEHFSVTNNLPLPSTIVLDIPFALAAGDLVIVKYQY